MIPPIPQPPPRAYRLHDGSHGNEDEAVREAIRWLETTKQEIEDKIEALRRQLETADQRPLPPDKQRARP